MARSAATPRVPVDRELLCGFAGKFLSNLNSVDGAFRSLRNGLLDKLPVGPLQKLVNPAINFLKGEFNKEIQKIGNGLGGLGRRQQPVGIGFGVYH